ncbi:MAG: MMPL family transporter [Zavarzinia sp.]|nr:MMPL family transporter [Zavarzinia sp.]
MSATTHDNAAPAGADIAGFDPRSGGFVERLVFNNRALVLIACALVTAFFAIAAAGTRLDAAFERMLPTTHPYIEKFLEHRKGLETQWNALRIVVEAPPGASILTADYLETLRQISDRVFLIQGIERGYMSSLWTPATRWYAVTEEGLDAGPVIPDDYDGSAEAIAQVRANLARSTYIGSLVAGDFRSSAIDAPVIGRDPDTGGTIDYRRLSAQLDQLRDDYATQGITIRITGYARVVGEMTDGLIAMLAFFGLAIVISGLILFFYTHSLRATLLVVGCSLVAVVWQLGAATLLGFALDPYSVLVPFLVFAIGMSHGAQKMNGVTQDIAHGTPPLIAARFTFRRLFMAGMAALLSDAVGFAVLFLIEIEAIRELAITASLGVGVLIFTNLILIPVLLSYVGVGRRAAARSARGAATGPGPVWRSLASLTRRGPALLVLAATRTVGVGGWVVARDLKIGDLDAGAPELRPESRYNRDTAYLIEHYSTSSDVLVVMAVPSRTACLDYRTLATLDRLEVQLRQLPMVEGTRSFASYARWATMGMNEQNPKWFELIANQPTLNQIAPYAPRELKTLNCDLLPLYAYLTDHKADTLATVVAAAADFIAKDDTPGLKIELAGGNAGVQAATNEVVAGAMDTMLFGVYGAVALLTLIAFRSIRATICALVPLVVTSILSEALMVALGIGVKVSTLPVVALGVGIGIDYALYVISVMLAGLASGEDLTTAYLRAMRFTGKVVLLTGFTMAAGVIFWLLAPIKFQADMGVILAFMFLWNMVGALVVVPALAFVMWPSARRKTI